MKTIISTLFVFASLTAFAEDARVVSVEPIYSPSTQSRQVCQPVTETRRSIGGTLLGGAIGGALGNQVGNGSGRTIATVVGAVTGAAVGQNVAGDNTVTKEKCSTEQFTTQTVTQYKVTVDVNGSYHVVYRDFSPVVGSIVPITLQVR